MENIDWNPSFSVGVALLDEQHKQLISMINLLLLEPEATDRSETASEVLTRMTKYAEVHFATEEGLMAQHGYPELSSHMAEDIAFRNKVTGFWLNKLDRQPSVVADVHYYLQDWWTQHILTADMRYSSFYKEKGVT